MIRFILFQTLSLILCSTLIGAYFNSILKLNLNRFFNLVLGFIIILTVFYLSGIIWVLFRLSTSSYYIFNLSLIGVVTILSCINFRRIQWIELKYIVIGIILVLGLMALTLRYSFGIRSFDAAVYMSSVIDNINAPYLNAFNPYDGKLQVLINVENDFQSYYHMNSTFLWLINNFLSWSKPDIYPSLISVYLISMTIFYFTFLYHLVLGTIQTFNLKSKTLIVFLIIYFFLFFTSFYYNSSLSFLGQSYRTLIIAFMSLLVYLNINKRLSNNQTILLLCIGSFATISTSSSAYFIVFILLFAWLFIKVKETTEVEFNRYCIIASLPIFIFVLLYGLANAFEILQFYFSLYIGLILLPLLFFRNFQVFKRVVQYFVPIFITIISISIIVYIKEIPITHIFVRASRYDMVWDYFTFHNLTSFSINTLIWLSFILFLIKSDNQTKNYFLTILIVFINPLNFVFITNFLAGSVVHRVFDVLFNPVTLIWLFMIVEPYCHKYLKIGVIIVISLIGLQNMSQSYHFVFNRPENSSYLDRINQNEMDVMNVLNTKIILEELERPKVISQIFYIKAFVKNIELPLSYAYYRKLDVYDEVVNAPNQLWNIFMVREYEAMRVFKQDPDYANVCQYIVEEKPDFVLVDKAQYYFDGENYVPIYFRVRGCGTNIYENDDYILYQFYW